MSQEVIKNQINKLDDQKQAKGFIAPPQIIQAPFNTCKKRVLKEKFKQIGQKKNFKNEISIEIDSNIGNEVSEESYFDKEAFDAIKNLTNKFDFTYKAIKNKKELKEYPLRDIPKQEIQELIRKERQKKQRHLGASSDNKGNKFSLRISHKRTSPNYFEEQEEILQDQCKDKELYKQETQINEDYLVLAQSLIGSFDKQSQYIKKTIVNSVALLLKNDESILQSSINQQVNDNIEQCQQLLNDRKINELKERLNQLSPMAAIIINYRLTQLIQTLIEESNTLTQILLPYIKECTNLDFLNQENIQTSVRFVHTLVQYYQDTQETIDFGLALYGLKFSPRTILPIIKTDQDKKVLYQAFLKLGFKKEQSNILTQNSEKFLWDQMINFLIRQTQNDQIEIIDIFSKLIILQDPEPYISNLLGLFAQRRIFTNALQKIEKVQLTIPQLIQVLDSLKSKETDQIEQFLSKDSKEWIKNSQTQQQIAINPKEELNEEALGEFLKEHFSNLPQKCIKNFQEVQSTCSFYQHNKYQTAVSQVILSQKEEYIIIEMPTGSGKTWIQALLAKYYMKIGKPVTIIEPNENLRNQTQELLSNLDHDLTVMTIHEFYQYPTKDSIVIVNEYDLIIQESSFTAANNELFGLWSLQNRKVFFFSATTNKSFEKIIKNIFQRFIILKFKSEFEMVKQISSVSQGIIKTFKNFEEILCQVQQDIKNNFEKKPIILFSEKEKEKQFIDLLDQIGIQRYLIGANQENLKEILNWKYGVLILHPQDGIGINCKFAIDSLVIITNEIKTESQYLQTQGRSSRARGLCESKYYVVSNLSAHTIQANMRSQLINLLQEKERLLKLIWAKRNTKVLIEAIDDSIENGDTIQNLKDLEQILGKLNYSQLIKGFAF